MRSKIISAIGAGALFLVLGCGTTSGTRTMTSIEREAVDVPARFEAPAGVDSSGKACKSPLTDPRNGTKIILKTSFSEGMGDYVVPAGMYGVGDRELLRINCATGEVVGVVRR
ncbi:hypothetical protein [Salinimicrobium sp. HB62]|uniref:hypothetical protein n=1 Tax=Salinimicrobium sp. HB62 TaxID=3077781 RepID=UPI002D78F10E|nr:hypothetical protein [Salinimicrobium sp. HB62]